MPNDQTHEINGNSMIETVKSEAACGLTVSQTGEAAAEFARLASDCISGGEMLYLVRQNKNLS